MITKEDRMKFAETWDSSKDPIIEDGKTLPQLLGQNDLALSEMWDDRIQGFGDQEIWEAMLLS